MIYVLPWVSLTLVSVKICSSTLPDLGNSFLQNTNSSSERLTGWIGDATIPDRVRASDDFAPNIAGLLAQYYSRNSQEGPMQNDQQFSGLESQHKEYLYHQSQDGRYDYRSSPHQDLLPMHSFIEYDATPLKKHDYGQNYGGFDGFSGGGGGANFGQGAGLAQAAFALKKGKEAKSLFILMAPLILLAVFGPILATQAMIPWVANGGLSTVISTAGSGKRRKRSLPSNPRQAAELEKRLQLFLAVQDFIAKVGSTEFSEEMGEAFLRCQKYTERRNKCLERIACEYTDDASAMDLAEKRIAKMVFQNVMSNPVIPPSIKGRLNKGLMFGKNHRGHCRNYWCEQIDGPRRKQ